MVVHIKSFDELTNRELLSIIKARIDVFVIEQNCHYQDIDGIDERALHVFIEENGDIKAYLRAYDYDADTAKIGRVLTTERGKGYGLQVVKEGIKAVRERMGKSQILVEAQSYATGFYEKEGFSIISDEFLDVGIPHKKMLLKL